MAAPVTPAPEEAAPVQRRRAEEMARWRRRSQKILFYRKALPWLMLAIVLAVAGWVGLRAFLSLRQADVSAATSAIHMTNPKFYGRDDKGRSFQLSARDAVRDLKDNNLITLTGPGMMLDTGGAQPIRVDGGAGVYRDDTKQLRLSRGVRLQDGRGSDFRSAEAVVDTRAGTVRGEKDVTGRGPLGQIAASSYAVQNGGDRIQFFGGVKSRIDNR